MTVVNQLPQIMGDHPIMGVHAEPIGEPNNVRDPIGGPQVDLAKDKEIWGRPSKSGERPENLWQSQKIFIYQYGGQL